MELTLNQCYRSAHVSRINVVVISAIIIVHVETKTLQVFDKRRDYEILNFVIFF